MKARSLARAVTGERAKTGTARTEARARGFVWFVRFVAVAGAFVVFGLGAWLLGVTALPLVWACSGGSLCARRRRCQRLVAASFRVFHAVLSLLGLVAFDARGALANSRWERGRQRVLVLNHPSLLENIAAIAVAGPVCCVVAPWLSRNPLLRPLLALCGHVRSSDDSLAGKLLALETAGARLAEGHSLLIFPEGTRSPALGLGEFQRGAFGLAIRAGLPLVPVAARVDPPVLTSDLQWYELPDRPVRLTLDPLDVWEPFDYSRPGRDAKWLARAVREQLARALDLPQPEEPKPPES